MRAYSTDLRAEVLTACDGGRTTAEVAKAFSVSPGWVRRLKQRRVGAGVPAPATPRRPPPALSAAADRIQEQVRATPGVTPVELKARLGLGVSLATVRRALRALGLPVNAGPPGRPAGPKGIATSGNSRPTAGAEQPALWRRVLDAHGGWGLTDPEFVDYWQQNLRKLSPALPRSVRGAVDLAAVAVDSAAWAAWVRGAEVLEAVQLAGGRLPAGEAGRRFGEYIGRCNPGPIRLPSGRVVMPNGFTPARAAVVPPSAAEWGRMGVRRPTPNAVHVHAFWGLVLATAAVPAAPVCRMCEQELPVSKAGRRSRRDICRRCENAAYYRKLRRRLMPLRG